MSQNSEDLKKSIKEHSEKLAKLGIELGKIQFNYTIKEKPAKKYWQSRINNFKKYNEKSLEYYDQAYSLMRLVNREESQLFLLRTSKFRQLGLKLIEFMEKIEENPSIIDSKDKQLSTWSKEIKQQLLEHGNKCQRHESDMNTSFREFYEKYLKG